MRGRTVVVTGASGFIGRHVVEALLAQGALVRAFGRTAAGLPARAVPVVGEIDDPRAVTDAMEGADYAVHAAAVTTNRVPAHVHERTNVRGTRTVLDAATAAGVTRTAHISSVVVYGVDRRPAGTVIAEDAPDGADDDPGALYLRSKLAADRMARVRPGVVVLRPGIVHGPGRAGALTNGLATLGPLSIAIGPGDRLVPLIHVDSVVDGILRALTTPGASGPYTLVDEPQLDLRSVVAAVHGPRARLVALPPEPLLSAAGLSRMRRREVPPRLSRFQVLQQARGVRYATDRTRTELGWTPMDTLQGIQRTLTAPG